MTARRAAAALALAAAVAAGCGDDDEDKESASAADVPADCASAAPKESKEIPDELPRPDGTLLVAEARTSDKTTIVQGFVARSPSDARSDLEHADGVRVLDSEDEGNDAEITVSDGKNRTAYKLVRACASGSRFTAVIVPEPS